MRKTLIAAASFFLLAFPAVAEVPAYTLVKDKSVLKFIATQNGAPVEGQFRDFTADIRFDPSQLEQSGVTVEVATGSVTVANEDIAQNVKTSDWLSVEAFPKAVFTSRKISRAPGADHYRADGDLTLRGKSVPVTLDFQIEHLDTHSAIANGSVMLRRNDFGVGQGEWAQADVIKNDVRVEFRVVAEKK
ncbi:MAG: YceI family protein [Pseudomonadota bacterium]|nr:YceI family protein [Pseudomonadota bacterium]